MWTTSLCAGMMLVSYVVSYVGDALICWDGFNEFELLELAMLANFEVYETPTGMRSWRFGLSICFELDRYDCVLSIYSY